MAGFRDQIESSKQLYDLETRQKMAAQELVEHYANFVTQSIRQRLLEVAQRITKTTTYEYRGVLLWEHIPDFFFESTSRRVKKRIFNVDCQHMDVTVTGKLFIRTVKDQLQADEIVLDGPYFSRIPRLTDGDGYYVVSPIEFRMPTKFLHQDYNSLSYLPNLFIIDEFSKVKASEVLDKLSLPVDYRFTGGQHGYDDISILQNGSERSLGRRSFSGEGPFMEICYRL